MLNKMKKEMYVHLTDKLIPFWKGMRDDEFGGYYGLLNYNLELDKKAVKGCILNSRILWFFSNAYMLVKDESLLDDAKHAYQWLKKYCVDVKNGGVYWSLNYDGTVADDTKHTYNQAFAIYALSSYYAASGEFDALALAGTIKKVVETKCKDEQGYLESFSCDFTPEGNDKLSENGVEAHRTMNTLLHVYEAYSEYLRVIKGNSLLEPECKKTADEIRFILDIVADKIYNPRLKRQEVFFDKDYNTLIDLHSFGHDIEASWLINRGLEILGDEAYTEKIKNITQALAKTIFEHAYVNNSVINESENGIYDNMRIWWVQAEAVLGFTFAYKEAQNKGYNETAQEYLQAADNVWEYIKEKIIDKREGSEWLSQVDENGVADSNKEIVEPWKCPYHNGRMCIYIQYVK